MFKGDLVPKTVSLRELMLLEAPGNKEFLLRNESGGCRGSMLRVGPNRSAEGYGLSRNALPATEAGKGCLE